ncbi:disulfide-bond oxidoreductase YfcG [Halomonas elongata]|uniref:Disulfide-bond oxidoreductase YfcG n=1 Tax=Halomonas elongata TaxID=2746 RepID=A0A1B8P1L0_HALEL|nr:disulfide-bond oxidoreductase YfcG [Halomonas elongata]
MSRPVEIGAGNTTPVRPNFQKQWKPAMTITITAFDWVPKDARGLVRDLRVRWALEEVGMPYDVRYLSLRDAKEPAHRSLQPFGQVPTYEENSLALFESGAIILHIAESYSGLLPDDAHGRARAISWMFAAVDTVEVPMWDYAMATILEGDKDWTKARLPIIEERIRVRVSELSSRLGDAEWFDGTFSAGDLMIASVLRHPTGRRIAEEYPNLADYIARSEARPAFKRALDAQLTGFNGKPPAGWQQ